MTMIYGHQTPSKSFMDSLMKKVNAYGTEPRVLIELDKFSYVPGVKSRFDIVEWIFKNEINDVNGDEIPAVNEPDFQHDTGHEPDKHERYEYIVCAAQDACRAWGLDKYAVAFLLAICKHETVFGTAGKGEKRKGSYVLGYGCPGNCNPSYAGIKTQFYYGAKRYREALGSKLPEIALNGLRQSDVDWFHEGGDKGYGRWVWSADGANWKRNVWINYQQLVQQDLSCSSTQALSTPNLFSQFQANQAVQSVAEVPAFPIEGSYFGSHSGDARVTSHSSKNSNKTRSNHRGIDLSLNGGPTVAHGKNIVACWEGTVKVSKYSSSYGEYVIVTHTNGWETLYAHLVRGSRVVSVGQKVLKGQVLGKLGNTGNVSPRPSATNPLAGTHLHFEIWKNGWVYGGNDWIDPYPVLTGAQKVSADQGQDNSKLEIIENVRYNKCYNKNGHLSEDFLHLEDVTWFTDATLAQKFVGYKIGAIKSGEHRSFAYKHNFSADGYFEYNFIADLKQGDTLTIRVDGIPTQIYTHEDTNGKIIYAPPVIVKYANVSQGGANSKIIDFHLESSSGEAYFGLGCFKVAEVEVAYGNTQAEVTQRLLEKWHDVGAFVYSDTITLESDIVEWEINNHFDMQSATARITLDNSKGLFSPTYERNPLFPDNLEESIYSWYENGQVQHIISEATPIRIYAGYGDQLIRVFTGAIKGEVEEDSTERTITFKCVDMYNQLEECVFTRPLSFPPVDEKTGHTEEEPKVMWLKSSIVQAIVREAGLVGWRYTLEDITHPDFIVEESVYLDIDKGERKAVKLDEHGHPQEVQIEPEQTIGGYKNPYVETAQFQIGARASDAINQLISDTMYRSYCNRYGTFILEQIPTNTSTKWSFIDEENLYGLDSSIDYSRVRNHLMIAGPAGFEAKVDHFFDRDLTIALKGNVRTAGIQVDWLDERFGSTARGQKETVANRLFYDMKRQSRSYSVVVKGNPMIDILDGCYIYDRNTSSSGYYMIKGNRLVGNQQGMLNFIELTWENTQQTD
ncbi:M23 family metallopeptidase [Bacillus horti]|nr:M23 family metallopeptidase [Bacillus horti]